MDRNPPPATIDDARVLAYLFIDRAIEFTGKLRLFSGDTKVGSVPCLAIADSPHSGLVVFHCDEAWNPIGVQAFNGPAHASIKDVSDVEQLMEKYYLGSMGRWQVASAAP